MFQKQSNQAGTWVGRQSWWAMHWKGRSVLIVEKLKLIIGALFIKTRPGCADLAQKNGPAQSSNRMNLRLALPFALCVAASLKGYGVVGQWAILIQLGTQLLGVPLKDANTFFYNTTFPDTLNKNTANCWKY